MIDNIDFDIIMKHASKACIDEDVWEYNQLDTQNIEINQKTTRKVKRTFTLNPETRPLTVRIYFSYMTALKEVSQKSKGLRLCFLTQVSHLLILAPLQ